jgi:hypothetical protein
MRICIRWVVAFVLLSLSVLGFVQATKGTKATAEQTTKDTKAEEEKLVGLEKQDWEITKKKDWKSLDKLLSADFVWIDDSGVIASRNDFVKYFANLDLTDYTMEDVKVTIFNSNVALLTYKVTEKGSFKGERLPSKPYYVGSGYLERGGEWVNIYTQTTLAR